MECWFRRIFLVFTASSLLVSALFVMPASAASGDDQVIRPEVYRRDINDVDIDTEDFEIGLFAGALSTEDFGTNFVYGAKAAFHVTELIFVEAAYGQSKTTETSFETLSSVTIVQDRTLQYYNVAFGYNLFPGESFIGKDLAFTSDFYLIGGVGSTNFAGDDHFTWNVGFGYKVLVNDWLAVRVDARDHIFDLELLGEKTTTNNLEFSGGFSIFF